MPRPSTHRAPDSATSHLEPVIREIAAAARSARLDYEQFRYVTKIVRQRLKMTQPVKKKRLIKILTDTQLQTYLSHVVDKCSIRDNIMLHTLFYSALRVTEVCNLEIGNIDLSDRTFRLVGKGDKERLLPFPRHFTTPLKAYIESLDRGQIYMFEGQKGRPITRQRVWKIMTRIGELLDLPTTNPHLFRHQMITYLTRNGVVDEQLMKISGHVRKETLSVYQHLNVEDVRPGYEDTIKKIDK